MAKTYLAKATVELNSPTNGSTMKYTVDGTTPTDASAVYSDPFDVYKNTKLKVVAKKDGLLDSEIASEEFNIKLPLEGSDLSMGGGATDVAFVIQNDEKVARYPNAFVYMTTNGAEPTANDIEVTTTQRSINANCVCKFKYIGPDNVPSDTYTVNITNLKCQTPIITVTGTEV